MSESALRTEYSVLRERHLERMAERLHAHLTTVCDGLTAVTAVQARAKTVDRFVMKALKTNDDGSPKYKDPIRQIQDQLGARVVVRYVSEVQEVEGRITEELAAIETTTIVPDDVDQFGYFGRHLILFLPTEAFESGVSRDQLPSFFELQIKTLFQHAWSEASHDLDYKPSRELSSEERRLIAFTAAQAWGADKVFDQLFRRQLDE